MRLLTKWLICFGSLLLANALFPMSFRVFGGLLTFAGAATVLWLVNLAIRPLFQLIALPFTIITFGLFSLVVNALMVRLAVALTPLISIRGFAVCLVIALMVSIGNSLFAANLRRKS